MEHAGRREHGTRPGQWLGCMALAFLAGGCSSGPGYPPSFLPGPETPGLASRWNGVIIHDEPVGGIVAMDLPAFTTRTVRPSGASAAPVERLAGPDHDGWVAYVDSTDYDFEANLYTQRFNAVRLDGTGNHVVFKRRLTTGSFNALGEHMALSPTGHHLAFITDYSGVQMTRPDAWLQSGQLQVWDIVKGTGGPVGITARDSSLSWFPDGRRLAYAALVPNTWAGKLASAPDGFGKAWNGWPRIPAVHIFDVKTGDRRLLCLGDDPVVSLDGRAVAVRDYDSNMRVVDVATGGARPVHLPGQQWSYTKSVLAFQGDEFLYWALPTAGTAPKTTTNNSRLVGPKWLLCIKAANVSTGKYETVWPDLDPRRMVDFGTPAPAAPATP